MNRRLYRSRTDTVIGGVAGGLAEYLRIDPALIRIAWAVLVFVTGGGALLAYVVAWVLVPEAPTGQPRILDAEPTGEPAAAGIGERAAEPTTGANRTDAGNGGLIVGLILVGAGLWFLAREYLPALDWGLIWPIVLIAVGGVVLVTSSRRRQGD